LFPDLLSPYLGNLLSKRLPCSQNHYKNSTSTLV